MEITGFGRVRYCYHGITSWAPDSEEKSQDAEERKDDNKEVKI